jgi:3',5'-cyclic AMP phosphodiesterase CpdA
MMRGTTNKIFALLALPVLFACTDSSDSRPDAPPPEPPPAVTNCAGIEINPLRLFLQQLGSDQVIIKWRGNADGGDEASSVCFGTDMAALPESSEAQAAVTATGHSEVLLTGLTPDTTYYYSIGGAGEAPESHFFHTAPVSGDLPASGKTRLWLVGDSGVAGQGKFESLDVRDGYLKYIEDGDGEPADLFIMLGDNAYSQGTDEEHQLAIFDVYTSILASTPLWPTIGNHEMGSVGVSRSADVDSYAVLGSDPTGGPDPAPDSPMPYLNIFSLPVGGEAGGLSSGTELYYSFDYGNVHIVSLDSQISARDETNRETMLQWLKDDLMANTTHWTVVIFHHPPYTKGSHDSDLAIGGIDQPIFDMREQFTPVFESYGVDVVYSGHSHIYERSYYINGHTGLASSFDPAVNAELNEEGQPANGQDEESYGQITKNGTDDKVIYTVAGNGGKVTSTSNGFPHPAHFFSELTLGSVVIDADASSLEARFIGVEGEVLDWFSVTR